MPLYNTVILSPSSSGTVWLRGSIFDCGAGVHSFEFALRLNVALFS